MLLSLIQVIESGGGESAELEPLKGYRLTLHLTLVLPSFIAWSVVDI